MGCQASGSIAACNTASDNDTESEAIFEQERAFLPNGGSQRASESVETTNSPMPIAGRDLKRTILGCG